MPFDLIAAILVMWGMVTVSLIIGYWMGRKTVRPDYPVFTQNDPGPAEDWEDPYADAMERHDEE